MTIKSDGQLDDYILLYELLTIAFIEIRASESLRWSSAMADVFHNVPGLIRSKADIGQVLDEIREKAARNNLADYIDRLLSHSARRVGIDPQRVVSR